MSEEKSLETVRPLSTMPEAAILRQFFRFIFNHLFIVLAGLAAGLALGLAAQRFLPVTYESEGSFLVDETPFLQNSSSAVGRDGFTESELAQSLITGIPSLNMRHEVAKRLGVPEKQLCFEDISSRPLSLRSKDPVANIRVSSAHNSRTATINVISQSAEFAAQVVNALLAELANYNVAQGRLNSLKLEMQFATVNAESLQTQLGPLDQARNLQEQQMTQLAAYQNQGLPLESFPAFATDTTLNNLKAQRLLAQADYANLATSSPGGMRLASKKAEVTDIENRIQQQAKALAAGLQSQMTTGKTQGEQERVDLDRAQQKVELISHEKAVWVQSFGDITAMKELIASHPNGQILPGSTIVVMNSAIPAEHPKSPKLWLNLVIGIFLGGLAGLALAMVQALLDNRLDRVASVTSLTGLACVAATPKSGSKFWGTRYSLVQPPHPAGFDPFRSRLLLAHLPGKTQIIGFTPAQKRERSSQFVANLAILLARAGHRTLVVDLNFSTPQQAGLLGLKPGPNLADWMASNEPIEKYISPSELPELGLLTCVEGKVSTADVAGRRPLAGILPHLQPAWDFILIDAPAISSNWNLALALPPGSPLVITANRRRTRAPQVMETAQRAQGQNWNVVGVALQRCPKSWTA